MTYFKLKKYSSKVYWKVTADRMGTLVSGTKSPPGESGVAHKHSCSLEMGYQFPPPILPFLNGNRYEQDTRRQSSNIAHEWSPALDIAGVFIIFSVVNEFIPFDSFSVLEGYLCLAGIWTNE